MAGTTPLSALRWVVNAGDAAVDRAFQADQPFVARSQHHVVDQECSEVVGVRGRSQLVQDLM